MSEATTCDHLFVEFPVSLISFACHLRIRVYAIHRLYIMRCIYYINSISSLCVSREMVYMQILSLHLPLDFVFWY